MDGDFEAPTICFTQSRVLLPESQRFVNSPESRYEQLKDAISSKDRGTILWLLKEGCPANLASADRRMDSALHVAVMAGDIDTLQLLLTAGARVSVANPHRQTALHMAFEMNDLAMVDVMLRECRDGRDNPVTVYGLSHFHIACVRNDWRAAHAYLERGVNANVHLEKCFYAKDYVYYRPLHLAVKHENFEVAELLLKYGANVDARDRYKRTPLHLACRHNYRRLCEAISDPDVKDWEDVTRIIKAENHQVDIVKLLLRFRADVNALDANGTPPLFHVFKCDYREVKAAAEARVRAAVGEGQWGELLAHLQAGQRDKFYALLQADVNVRFVTEARESLVHLVIDGRRLFGNSCCLAAKERDLEDAAKAEAVALLLRYGADVEARTASGQTALQLAVAGRYPLTAKVLLEHRASVAGICFFHYREPGRNADGRYDLQGTEDFMEVLGLLLRRKTELGVSRGNELLMLRQMSREPCIQHLENCDAAELRHLLDFGDVASIDLASFDSERSVLSNREKVRLLLEHVQKLRVAGLPVDEEVSRKVLRYERLLDAGAEDGCARSFVERCKREIRELRRCMIDRYASFYDLLFLNVNEIAVRVKNDGFRKAVRDSCYARFALYSNVIIKQFVKGLIRAILLESAKENLAVVIGAELPEPCMENVIGHLKNEDLCNLALAFER